MPKIKKGLVRKDPKNFITGESYLYEIVDVIATELETKDKKSKYTQYTLQLIGSNDGKVEDCEIAFLFDRDLNALIDEFGEDTDAWKGKQIEVSANMVGQYARWILIPSIIEKVN